MSNYTQAISFGAKDVLSTSDPAKVILGANIDSELVLIATAITSKLNTTDLAGNYTITGNITFTGTNVIPAAGLTGTVVDARLSANVPLLNAANAFSASAAQSITSTGQYLSLNTTNANGGYVSFARNAAIKGYIGDSKAISGGTLDNIEVFSSAGLLLTGTSVSLNGVAATDFARLSQNNTFSGANIISLNAGTVFKSTINTAAINNYLSFQDSSSVERAYIGFGLGASSIFSLRNSTAGAELRLSSNAGSITLDGVNVTDYARKSAANTFTNDQLIQTAANATLTLNTTATTPSYVTLQTNSSTRAFIGAAGNNGDLITGSLTGDLLLRAQAGGISFSGDAGTTAHFKISSAGVLTTPNASASEVGFKGIPQNTQSVDYTCVLADANKEIYQTGASKTITIPANASVAYPIGTILTGTFTNATGGTVAITTDTMTLAATTTTGSRTIVQNGKWTAQKETATTWLIFGAGVT